MHITDIISTMLVVGRRPRVKDSALSRLKHWFDSRRGHQSFNGLVVLNFPLRNFLRNSPNQRFGSGPLKVRRLR